MFLFGMVYFGLSSTVKSQEFCATPAESTNRGMVEYFDMYGIDYSAYYFCVKIYIHVIRKSDGTGGQTVSDVNTMMGYLNMDFNPHKIYFEWDGIIDYIDSTSEYYDPSGTIFNINDNTDGVDIYLYGDESGDILNIGLGEGLADGIGIEANLLLTGLWEEDDKVFPITKSHVISHEMGHVLFLWHTHHGTFPEYSTTDPSQCPELVNGSNSSVCGDYIIDTPADPFMNHNVVVSTCTWPKVGPIPTDANGDFYDPDELNIMGYTLPSCMSYFTTNQANG